MGLLCDLVMLFSIYSTRDFGYIANEKTHDLQYGLSLLLVGLANFGEELLGALCQISRLALP